MSAHTTVVADFLSHTSTGIVSTTAQSSASSPGDHGADVGSETSTTGQNSASTIGDRDAAIERKNSLATTAQMLGAEVLWGPIFETS